MFETFFSTEKPLHEAIKPLSWLLGKWTGQGKGIYPTIEDFDYLEELEFSTVGQPMLQFRCVCKSSLFTRGVVWIEAMSYC